MTKPPNITIPALSLILSMAPLAALAAPVTVEFQQGLNDYAGTVDWRLRARDTVDGATRATDDVDGGNTDYGFGDPDYSVLYLLFNDILGDGPGQVPYGSVILNATVELTTNVSSNAQTGNAFTLAPLIEPLRLPEEGSAGTIYTLYTAGNVPRGPNFPDGATLRPGNGFRSVLTPNLQDQGEKSYNDVTEIIRYWANTTSDAPLNHGFIMNDANGTDAWTFGSSANGVIENRPKLSITYYTPAEAAARQTRTALFRQGEFNEGQGTTYEDCVSVFLPDPVSAVRASNFAVLSARVPVDGAAIAGGQFLDGADGPAATSPDDQLNIQFKSLFGDQPGQIAVKPNLNIERAVLRFVTGPSGNAYSPGPVNVSPFLKPWYTEDGDGIRTFKKFTDYTAPDAPAGTVGLGPTEATGDLGPVDGTYWMMGFNMIVEADVSKSIRAWADGQPNYGWNVQMESSDGWQLYFPGASDATLRPQLLITYSYNPDDDSDGLPNDWETANGTDPKAADADADPDQDGLTNKQEFERGTKPLVKDTDGDGYDDKAETGTGIWESPSGTGSNPLVADTDGDGLPDGLENPSLPHTGATQPGSDPNKMDSDGDGFTDPGELAFGTNPGSAASVPAPSYTTVLADNFDGQAVASEPQFTTTGGAFAAGILDSLVPAHANTAQITDGTANCNSSIAWDYVAAKGKAVRLTFDYRLSADGAAEAADGFGIGLYRTSAWDVAGAVNPGAAPRAWEEPRTGGGFNDALHFAFDIYTGATEGNNVRVAGPADPTGLLINKVAPFQINNGLFNRVVITGVTMGNGSSSFSMDIITDADGAAVTNSLFKNLVVPGFDITKEEFRLIAGARSGTAVVKSEFDNVSLAVAEASTVTPPAPPAFSITGITAGPESSGVTISWDSVNGGVYTLERSTTLTGAWETVGTPVTATGGTSALTDSLPSPVPAVLFYRVRRGQ